MVLSNRVRVYLEMYLKSKNNSLIDRASGGDDSAFAELCSQYGPLIRSMSRRYAHMAESDDEEQIREDFSQEATLALYRAVQSYDSKGGKVSFGLYAKICIRNALVSELRRMERGKKADKQHKKDIRLSIYEKGIILPEREVSELLKNGSLSAFEKSVFDMYVSGAKVKDISKALGRSGKSVSNAVYRIKSKLRMSLDGDEK